jgi:hypothetical protein
MKRPTKQEWLKHQAEMHILAKQAARLNRYIFDPETKLEFVKPKSLERSITMLCEMKKPHKEVWLVQAFDETDTDTILLFYYAFTDRDEAIKVRDAGLAANTWAADRWTLERVVLDDAEDAMRTIIEMATDTAKGRL